MQQNWKNAKGDEYICKALYLFTVPIMLLFVFVFIAKAKATLPWVQQH